jgi:hypothetical protein
VAIFVPVKMSCEEFSLSTEMPSFAIWFGTPSRLSPKPFHTPVRSGWPSGVRGVVPDGLGGALVVRFIWPNSWATTAHGAKHSTAAKRIIQRYAELLMMLKLLSRELAGGSGVHPERPSAHFKFTEKTSSGPSGFGAGPFRIGQPENAPIVGYLFKNFQRNYREERLPGIRASFLEAQGANLG